MKQLSRLKPYLSWLILGGTLFFLASTLRSNWQQVSTLRIDSQGWAYVALALGATLLSHIWASFVWQWIFATLHQPVASSWAMPVYLKTNIAKYLPGGVWHFVARVQAAKAANISTEAAILGAVLEPLLMAAAALVLALGATVQVGWGWQILAVAGVLAGVHPRILNPIVRSMAKSKAKKVKDIEAVQTTGPLQHYPILPLLGELGFVLLRGSGFLLAVLPFHPIHLNDLPYLFSAFSLAWVMGLVVPGAPGGLGVFEATAVALMQQRFTAIDILGAVALYRLVSVLAEILGAGLAVGYQSALGPKTSRTR